MPGSPLGPDTQEVSHDFSLQTETNNRKRIPHLLVIIFNIPKSCVTLELRIVVRNIVRSPEKDFLHVFAAIV